MTSEIRIQEWSGRIVASGGCRSGGSPDFRKTLGIILLLGLAPLAMWLLGTAFVRVVPPVYRSGAVLRLPTDKPSAVGPLDSPAVMDEAASALAAGNSPHPMATQVLRSNLTL